MDPSRVVAVTGATGRQGGAVVEHLLADGWRVRGLTRHPDSAAARRVAALGAELVTADMMSPTALDEAFRGVDGVYSVQTGWDDGFEAEVIQGINVADAARRAGVAHIVYGSAGPGEPGTGVGSWDSKETVAAHMRSLALPLTVLRPTAFMELMTDRDFYPMVSTWQVMPKVMGADRPVPWLAVDDLGAVAARVFADPDAFVGGDIPLAGDRRSITECAEIWRRVHGRAPRRIPMPVGMFERFVGRDLIAMWRWLSTSEVDADPADTRRILPTAHTVDQWLSLRASPPRNPK
jgi:uncharacterized protein YbjT (DUF2867 family)